MGILKVYADVMDEATRLQKDYGLDYHAAARKAKEIYKDELKKAQSLATTQEKEPNKIINDIIPPGTDIDNDQIYIKETGEVLKDLN